MKKFIKKHPWLLFKCIALTSWFCGFLATRLTKAMLLLLDLKGKDPNYVPPPPPPPPGPTKEPLRFQLPWVPSWVGATFARGGLFNHPVLKARAEFEASQKALEEARQAPLVPTVAETTEVGSGAIDSLRQAVANVEQAADLSKQPTRKLKKPSKKD